jgi:hypothetical protein
MSLLISAIDAKTQTDMWPVYIYDSPVHIRQLYRYIFVHGSLQQASGEWIAWHGVTVFKK